MKTSRQQRLALIKYLAIFIVVATGLLQVAVVYAAFEPRPEYRSVIDTDPETRERFRYLFQQHQPQINR